MPKAKPITIDAGGREVTITNPDKVYFPHAGYTKLDLVNYYLAVGDGALRGVFERPMVLKRFVDGAEGEPFFQKRAPRRGSTPPRSRSPAAEAPTWSSATKSPTFSGR
jgi:DNA primase